MTLRRGDLAGLLGNLPGLLSGEGEQTDLLNAGKGLLNTVFGGRLPGVVDLVAQSSGIKTASALALLSMLAPLLLGIIGQQGGTSVAGITTLLGGQKDLIARLAPAGLAGALGLGSLNDLGAGLAGSVTSTATNATGIAARAVTEVAGMATGAATLIASFGHSLWKWLIPVVALGGLAVWFFLAPRQSELQQQATSTGPRLLSEAPVSPRSPAPSRAQPAPGTPVPAQTTEVPEPDRRQAAAALEEARRRTEHLANEAQRQATDVTTSTPQQMAALTSHAQERAALVLPGGVTLHASAHTTTYQLATFLSDTAATTAPKNFVFDALAFESGTHTLTPASLQTVQDLVAILKAYPSVEVQLAGHTDSTGHPEASKQLSHGRAEAVKAAITTAGIDESRLTTVGYGAEKPLASNDTEEGRAQNRRLELLVVKK